MPDDVSASPPIPALPVKSGVTCTTPLFPAWTRSWKVGTPLASPYVAASSDPRLLDREGVAIRVRFLSAPPGHPVRDAEIRLGGHLTVGALIAVMVELYPDLAGGLPPRRDDMALGRCLRVLRNGQPAKLAEEVADGDLIEISLADHELAHE